MINSSPDTYDLIVGASGQDGFFLSNYLKSIGRKILCIDRDGLVNQNQQLMNFDICKKEDVETIFQNYPINHVYYLAAHHHSAEESQANNLETLKISMDIHVYALEIFLNTIQKLSPKTKIFYAASSHLFSGLQTKENGKIITIDENTPITPNGWYAHTKAIGVELMRVAKTNGLFAISGFLFNHESERRPQSFLSSKLTNGAIDAYLGSDKKINLLSSDTKVDWGYAPDFVRAMHLCLETEICQDYIISTGKLHTIENYAQLVYALVGRNWLDYITINNEKEKKHGGASAIVGNALRLKTTTKWQPIFNFEEMVARILLDTAKARNIEIEIN